VGFEGGKGGKEPVGHQTKALAKRSAGRGKSEARFACLGPRSQLKIRGKTAKEKKSSSAAAAEQKKKSRWKRRHPPQTLLVEKGLAGDQTKGKSRARLDLKRLSGRAKKKPIGNDKTSTTDAITYRTRREKEKGNG